MFDKVARNKKINDNQELPKMPMIGTLRKKNQGNSCNYLKTFSFPFKEGEGGGRRGREGGRQTENE